MSYSGAKQASINGPIVYSFSTPDDIYRCDERDIKWRSSQIEEVKHFFLSLIVIFSIVKEYI